ncbi:MAG: YjfB family protein [Lachnospiraceae bacterium]|nr:YjfB family protein [Lachnospiraceae bacterium]
MEIGALNNTALYALNSATTKTGEILGVAMLSNQLEVSQTMGDSMIRAMELSVNPSVGGNIDVSV